MKKGVLFALLMCAAPLFGKLLKVPNHVFPSVSDDYRIYEGEFPFPTDLTFRKCADHIVDRTVEYFDPDAIGCGDTVFLADWLIPWFYTYVHPNIESPYIVITSDSDGDQPHSGIWDYDEKNGAPPPVTATRAMLYDPKVAAWFSRNMFLSRHPKIHPIPVGQNVVGFGRFRTKNLLLELLNVPSQGKQHLLYLNFNPDNDKSRRDLLDHFCDKRFAVIKRNLSKKDFYQDLADSYFVACPRGYGIDTVRFWESVVLGAIPVVEHSVLDDLYADLPVLFVHAWEELNENFLRKKYLEISNKGFSKEKAFFPYWEKKIQETQKAIRSGKYSLNKVEKTKFSSDTLDQVTHILKKFGSAHQYLLMKGAVLSLRPFQIASALPTLYIYTQDPWGAWGHETSAAALKPYVSDPLLRLEEQITPISYYNDPWKIFNKREKMVLFLDLTYKRDELYVDLKNAIEHMGKGSLICGNLSDDPFVREVLKRVEKIYKISFRFDCAIWYCLI